LPLSLLFAPRSRADLQEWVARCFAGPALVDLCVTASQGPFRPTLTGRLLLLPMLDAEGGVTRALGGLLLDGVPRKGGLRLDLAPQPFRFAPIAENRAPTAPVGFAEPGRPWLRLVVSNP
jgi:hypothetical protein